MWRDPWKMRKIWEEKTGEISIQRNLSMIKKWIPAMSGYHVKMWSSPWKCWDSTFNVVFIIGIWNILFEIRNCQVFIPDELMEWFEKFDVLEAEGLTVWCIWICLCNIHSVSSILRPYPEYVCVPNCTEFCFTNRRLQNYDTESINCGRLWI